MSDEIGNVNDVDRLRGMLFAAAKGLQEKRMTAEDAKALAEIGQTLINTAKIELEFSKQIGKQVPSKFIPRATPKLIENGEPE